MPKILPLLLHWNWTEKQKKPEQTNSQILVTHDPRDISPGIKPDRQKVMCSIFGFRSREFGNPPRGIAASDVRVQNNRAEVYKLFVIISNHGTYLDSAEPHLYSKSFLQLIL